MKRVNWVDLSIAYEEEGDGYPLLLIHGYPLNRLIWQNQLEGLANSARVIAPDLRNHGDSIAGSGIGQGTYPHTMDLLAEDLARMLDTLEITQPVAVGGLSMGGYVAFAFYRSYPERVGGLILTATRASSDSAEAKSNRIIAVDLARTQGVGTIIDSMLPRLVSPYTISRKPELVQQIKKLMMSNSVDGVVGDLLGMMDRPDSTLLLPQIHVPVLILMGRDDQIIPITEAQEMNNAIPDSRLQVIPDAGHLPNMEQPEMYNQIVRTFIQTLDRGPI